MKKRLILIGLLVSVMLPTQAYVIIIQRTTIGHTGGTSENYDYASRSETDINSELQASQRTKSNG